MSFDITGAFDNIGWETVREGMTTLGIPEVYTTWVLNSLQGRSITFEKGAKLTRYIQKGCSQGSVIGPTMWNIVAESLLLKQTPSNISLHAYAEDIFLLVNAKTEHPLKRDIDEAVALILEW